MKQQHPNFDGLVGFGGGMDKPTSQKDEVKDIKKVAQEYWHTNYSGDRPKAERMDIIDAYTHGYERAQDECLRAEQQEQSVLVELRKRIEEERNRRVRHKDPMMMRSMVEWDVIFSIIDELTPKH